MLIYALGILEQDNKILLLLRRNTKFFDGYYGLMGGKIEESESPSATLIREAYEELGITIIENDLHFAHCLSFKNETDQDVLALVFKVNAWEGNIINKELEKCANLEWFTYSDLPENIIPRHKLIIEKINESIPYCETGW